MSSIHQEVVFQASAERIYEALMDAKQHSEFTGGGEAEISREAGGPFRAHGGRIEGRNIELVPNSRIVQAWRPANWEAGVYSVVKLELQEEEGATKVVLDHTGVPAEAREHIDGGWHQMYWGPLKQYLA